MMNHRRSLALSCWLVALLCADLVGVQGLVVRDEVASSTTRMTDAAGKITSIAQHHPQQEQEQELSEFDNIDDESLGDWNEEEDSSSSPPPPSKAKRNLQSSSSSSTQRVNILQKLGESIGQTIIGCLLLCVVPFFIWKNEGRHAKELSKIDFCKNEAVSVDCNKAGDDTVGRLVHFTGTVKVGDDSSLQFDPQSTGASLNTTRGVPRALILKRTCYIYQKFEDQSRQVQQDRLGGGETRTTNYTLREDWTPVGPQSPTLEHLPGHTNSRGIWDQLVQSAGPSANGGASPVPLDQMPPQMLVKLGMYDANQAPHGLMVSHTARVGEFGLTREVIAQNPAEFLSSDDPEQLKPVPNTFLPDYFPDCPLLQKGSDNILRTFPENSQPMNGDCKVVFEFALDGFDASFVVSQVGGGGAMEQPGGDELDSAEKATKYRVDKAEVPAKCNGDLGTVWMVRRGRHDLSEMIDMAKVQESQMTKILRVVCWALLCVGWAMVSRSSTNEVPVPTE